MSEWYFLLLAFGVRYTKLLSVAYFITTQLEIIGWEAPVHTHKLSKLIRLFV